MFQSVSKRLNNLINSQYQQRISTHRNTYTSRQPTSRTNSIVQENIIKNKIDFKVEHQLDNFAQAGQTSIQNHQKQQAYNSEEDTHGKFRYPNSYKEIIQQKHMPLKLNKYHTFVQQNKNFPSGQKHDDISQAKSFSASQEQNNQQIKEEENGFQQSMKQMIIQKIQSAITTLIQKMRQDLQFKFTERINELDNKNKQMSQKLLQLQQIIKKQQQYERNLTQTFDPKYFQKIQLKRQQINAFAANLQTPKRRETEVKNKLFYSSPIHIAILQSPKQSFIPSIKQQAQKNLNPITPISNMTDFSKNQSDILINNLTNRIRQLQYKTSNGNCKCQFLVENFIRNQQHLLSEIKILKYGRQFQTEMKTPKNCHKNLIV